MGRAPCCEKVGLKRGRWTAEEDEILTKYIQLNGEGSWRSLPKNAGLLRCGKSCRLRWINYLRSGLKRGNITSEEENLVIKLHATMGNRWSLIAGHLPGRTDNEIKNYWNSHLCRKIDTFITRRQVYNPNNTITTFPVINNLVNKTDGVTNKRRGGRTSRSAMKITKEYRQTRKTAGVTKLPPPPPPSMPPKEAQNSSSSPVAVMPATPIIDKEKSILSSSVSWTEENLESFFTESYSIDDVLMLDDNELMNKQEEAQVENSNEDFQSLGTIEFDNVFCNLLGSENQESGQFGSWCPDSPVFSMLENEGQIGHFDTVECEGHIGHFDTLECDVDTGARGNEEEGILSWLWDTSPHEGGDELLDVEKQNAMVSWLLS